MNVGLSFNPAMFSRATMGPSQAQVNAQASVSSGSDYARDCVVINSNRQKAAKLVGNRVGKKRVLDKAGVTKVAAAKKR